MCWGDANIRVKVSGTWLGVEGGAGLTAAPWAVAAEAVPASQSFK